MVGPLGAVMGRRVEARFQDRPREMLAPFTFIEESIAKGHAIQKEWFKDEPSRIDRRSTAASSHRRD